MRQFQVCEGNISLCFSGWTLEIDRRVILLSEYHEIMPQQKTPSPATDHSGNSEIDRVRKDTKFINRVKQLAERDREILDELAK
ncbi:MAG: hypothetical protein D4R95_07465 [Actinobacteria bacterium]|nr:MAG: hypothetical protein D4R95_07465 [Actinomycetota bacterium]